MSRIERKYCLISTSHLASLFDIFILLHIWQNCVCFGDYLPMRTLALWLVNFASRTLLYGPLILKVSFSARPINLKDIINILLTSFSRSVL